MLESADSAGIMPRNEHDVGCLLLQAMKRHRFKHHSASIIVRFAIKARRIERPHMLQADVIERRGDILCGNDCQAYSGTNCH